ncbi:ABC transporter permease [Sporolactobacillus spathodeae]|uniref:Transport permease protein n=1 Tax=Sporolactobacillus spathodeae TaxID=1465502 RepID=A0ABS2Q972_9BACL|nr:ABC transporter permease [Sporolactobacillus spathodeae]MBM7658319.1 teichoic acid transport system permease protein [Sporolactobacillus spathodeae]
MKSAWRVIKEQLSSLYLIRRLSLYELKSENNNNYLGMAWIVINPMIQIFIYWLVFGEILNKKAVIVENGETVPYFDWLVAGIFIWFYLQPAVIQGSKSVYSRIKFIAKMNFPMSTIPTYVIFEKFYQHLLLTVLVLIYLQFTPYKASLYLIQLPYFMFASLAFLVSISLITSTFSTIIRDVHQILISFMRMIFYLTPFLWEPSRLANLPHFVHNILLLNPMYYLVQGYRSTMLGISWYPIDHLSYTIYFWLTVLLMFILGSSVHLKFRDHFVDYL